uniref:DUF4794 domain-containing protein n=1 Tax=Anopheles atroparvus TaxID=41427 RepID=A0A182IWI2_ANOAO
MNRYCALLVLLVATVAAQYPASGWRPEGAQFRLPAEYGAPLLVFQPQPQRVQVQITRENVRFAGQQVAEEQPSTTTVEPVTQSNQYIPPATTTTEQPELDPLKVQGLPSDQTKDFQQRANLRQQSAANRQLPTHFGQRQFFPISGQLRALPPVGANVFQQQVVQPQAEQPAQQQIPAETYGPPEQEPEQPEELPATTEQTSVQQEDGEDEYDGDDNGPVVAVSNAFSGQYYILAPDNTLQRVIYSTMQTDEDRLVNGFSAQLKYAPVDPIRDPVYTYNEQGQLIRIYKK